MARSQGLQNFCETSALQGQGVEECFQATLTAATMSLRSRRHSSRAKKGISSIKFDFFGLFSQSAQDSRQAAELPVYEDVGPQLPPAPKAPWILIGGSTIGSDWATMLEEAAAHDDDDNNNKDDDKEDSASLSLKLVVSRAGAWVLCLWCAWCERVWSNLRS